jgi:hypothetical protein
MLGEPALRTVFARAYEISQLKVENWPASPIELGSIYNEVIMPPLRKPSRLKELQAAWIKRIQREGAMAEYWPDRREQGRRPPGADNNEPAAYARFLENTQPRLQWEMEVDLFRNGDESGAATRMLALLEKNISRPSAKAWSDQFKQLLKTGVPAAEISPEPPVIGDASP